MSFDGELRFNTSVDASGFKLGLDKLSGLASAGIKAVTGAVTLASGAVAAFGAYATKVGSSFESSMSQVCATMAITKDTVLDDGVKPFEVLQQAAKDAGSNTQYSATEAADALNYLALAGYSATQAADALPAVLNLAAAGGMDLAYASDLATDAMAALGIEATNENLTHFGDELAKTASKANANVSQLGEAILTVGGTAKALAGGTTELNAALGVLANRGIKGSEGGTALRNVILSLSAPTDQAADAIESLGLKVYDAEGDMRPLNEIFKDLDGSLASMNAGDKTQALNKIFNKVDLKSVQAMLAGCGTEYDNLYSEISNCDGAMADMAKTMNDNLQGDMKSLGSKCESLGIAVYGGIQEPLRELAGKGIEYVQQLTEAFESGGFEGLVSEIGTVLSEVVSYISTKLPMLLELGASVISSFVDSMLKTIPTVLPELIKCGIEMIDGLCQGIADTMSKLAEILPKQIMNLIYAISEHTENFAQSGIEIITALINGIADSLPYILEAADEIVYGISNTLINGLPALIDAGQKLINNLITGLSENLSSVVESAAEIIRTYVTAISDNLPMLITAAIELINVLADALFENIDTIIDAAIEIIMAIVNGLLQNIDKLIKVTVKIIMAVVNAITRNVGKLTQAAVDIITAVAQALIDNLPLLLEAAFQIIAALVTGLIQALPQLADMETQMLESLWQVIKNTDWALLGAEILLGIGNGVRNGISGVVSWFSGFFAAMDEYFSVELPKTIEGIVSWFRQLPGKIAVELSTIIANIIQWGSDIAQNASDAASTFINNVATFFQELPGKVKEKLQEVIEKVLSWASEMKAEAQDAASKFISEIITKVTSLPSDIYNKIKSAVTKVKEWGEELAKKGKDAAKDLFDNIVDTITGLPDKLREIGSNIVEGLWNGINDMAGWVEEKITGFGEGILDSLKEFFGIHSPSRVMRDIIGKNLVLGIGVGIDETMPTVTADALDAFDSLTGAVDAINFAAPSPYSNVSNHQISNTTNNKAETRNENNFYINAQNPQKTAEQISEELATLERKTRAGKGY
ncbi:MAG: phage tail tape measure protein [Oscillospiraceae bacterium]|nr:phage tail tape measure protein [Oscillospiraceae bacterium]